MIHGHAARLALPSVVMTAPAPHPALIGHDAERGATTGEPALPVLRLAIAVAAIFAFGALAPMIAAAAR